ncbi:hypothetical protein TNCV_4968621 [Trichonephila clavipes]|nr:hypothetical protein TNCV_4968621 [Trichonephila clavipes]
MFQSPVELFNPPGEPHKSRDPISGVTENIYPSKTGFQTHKLDFTKDTCLVAFGALGPQSPASYRKGSRGVRYATESNLIS